MLLELLLSGAPREGGVLGGRKRENALGSKIMVPHNVKCLLKLIKIKIKY